MVIKIGAILFLALCSGYTYRRGGTNKGTKWRDFGVPIIFFFACLALKIYGLKHIGLSCLLLFGACTTYFKKSGDPQPKHWISHGLAIGLSAIPLYWCGVAWTALLWRTLALAIGVPIFFAIPHDDISESGRGFLIIATLLMLR